MRAKYRVDDVEVAGELLTLVQKVRIEQVDWLLAELVNSELLGVRPATRKASAGLIRRLLLCHFFLSVRFAF